MSSPDHEEQQATAGGAAGERRDEDAGHRTDEDAGDRAEPTVVDVYVEIPKGSRNKYEWDTSTGRFRLDRKLFSAVQYPGDYGFVAEAWGEDGDPLDALVILGDPTFPGCVISARVVGVFYMEDDKGRDTKIITVPSKDPQWAHIDELEDVPKHLLDEISHFFSIYKDLEQKKVAVHGYGSRQEAIAELERDFERFRNLEEPRPIMPWTPFAPT